jgi:hypothetical protein
MLTEMIDEIEHILEKIRKFYKSLEDDKYLHLTNLSFVCDQEDVWHILFTDGNTFMKSKSIQTIRDAMNGILEFHAAMGWL